MSNEVLDLLRKYPWPAARPYASEEMITHDGGGRRILTDLIAASPACTILEIGSFLGGSARQWLEASPNSTVVCVDPWEGDWWIPHAITHNRMELARRFAEPNGPLNCFLTNMWPFKDRVVAYRGRSPDAIVSLHAEGLRPDIVYFDSDKSGAGMTEAIKLFPDAIIGGDDWTWGRELGYPIRESVRKAAKSTDRHLLIRRATWLLLRDRPNVSQRLGNIVSLVADLVRPFRGT